MTMGISSCPSRVNIRLKTPIIVAACSGLCSSTSAPALKALPLARKATALRVSSAAIFSTASQMELIMAAERMFSGGLFRVMYAMSSRSSSSTRVPASDIRAPC
jgi:hypothetical protein